MIAYSNKTLVNLYVREQSKEAEEVNCITPEERTSIHNLYSIDLYSPNMAVRFGLGFLTLFIVVFSLTLFGWMFDFDFPSISSFLFVCAAICYAALELVAGPKKHYNSGVDNMLTVAVSALLLTGMADLFFDFTDFASDGSSNGQIGFYLSSLLIFGFLTIRFVDRIMAIGAAISLFLLTLFMLLKAGGTGAIIAPFVLMAVTTSVYLLCGKLSKTYANIFRHVLSTVAVVSLICLYLSGNFFVVEMMFIELAGRMVPGGIAWFFWVWTFVIPIVFVVYGIMKKDIVLTRLGILAMIGAFFTYQEYFFVPAAEVVMIVSGMICIAVAYSLMRYLRTSRNGFSFVEKDNTIENTEAIVIGQVFAGKSSQAAGKKFGGGSFGGGGAADNY